MPVIGALDTERTAHLTDTLLDQIAQQRAVVVIMDISGVATVDVQVTHHLFQTIQTAALMGADSIISGIRPETAQTISHLGIDTGPLHCRRTLADALQLALSILERRTVPTANEPSRVR